MAPKNHITAIILDYSLKNLKKYKIYSPGTPWYFSIHHSPHIGINYFGCLWMGIKEKLSALERVDEESSRTMRNQIYQKFGIMRQQYNFLKFEIW